MLLGPWREITRLSRTRPSGTTAEAPSVSSIRMAPPSPSAEHLLHRQPVFREYGRDASGPARRVLEMLPEEQHLDLDDRRTLQRRHRQGPPNRRLRPRALAQWRPAEPRGLRKHPRSLQGVRSIDDTSEINLALYDTDGTRRALTAEPSPPGTQLFGVPTLIQEAHILSSAST